MRICICCLMVGMLCGCGKKSETNETVKTEDSDAIDGSEGQNLDNSDKLADNSDNPADILDESADDLKNLAQDSDNKELSTYDGATDESPETEEEQTTEAESQKNNEPQPFKFVDVFGEEYETVINPNIPVKTYKDEGFVHDGYALSYVDPNGKNIKTRLGIDVSHHQKEINWAKVSEAGYEFAFVRVGYRGYGSAGQLNADKYYKRNIEEAHKYGLDVGVYFFAQAIDEKEALEEAEYVIGLLKDYDLELPVVYDPESILDDVARTDNVSGEQFTKNSIVFCETIAEAGYEPAIYSNMLWEAFELDLTKLPGITVWYADYEPAPQTPYDFEYWQYSNEARVPGVNGACDVDIQMIVEKE